MKRRTVLGSLALLLLVVVSTAATGRLSTVTAARPHKQLSVLLFIDGSLGDQGFFDSAHAGVVRAQKSLGVTIKVVQQADPTQWQGQLLLLAGSHKYDLIILDATDPTMTTAVQALMKRYPQQRIIDFDDNQFAGKPSVSSIIYRQNEGSFLAGALAALVADSNLKYVSHKKIVGMVGGMAIPVILDFKDGFVQGATYVDPRMQVRVTYIGGSGSNDTWNNKAKGAQLARALYNQGAAVVYQVAGGSGLGVLEQAKASGRYAIGVDQNQDNQAPGHVIGSVVKHVDNSLYVLIQVALKGQLKGGKVYYFGLPTGSVALTKDSLTRSIVPASIYSRLDQVTAQIVSGKIKVRSEFK